MAEPDKRQRNIRARNRALFAVLLALALLFYAIAIVRIMGSYG